MYKLLGFGSMFAALVFATTTDQSGREKASQMSPCGLQAQGLCTNREVFVSISGTVTSAEKPVADAIVIVQIKDRDGEVNPADPFTSFSDAAGRFVFVGLKSGQYLLTVMHSGYEKISSLVTVAAATTAILPDLSLKPLKPFPLPSGTNSYSETLYYVTDRQALFHAGQPCTQSLCYGNERAKSGRLSYGSVDARFVEPSSDPIALGTVQESEKDSFFKSVRNEGTNVLVFVHGFDNSFASGLLELAAIKKDLDFKGPVIIFSWASRDEVDAYFEDESTIDWSAPHFREALRSLDGQHFAQLDLIAHSMGNRLLLRGLDVCRHSKWPGQMIFVAPDVDADTFQQAVTFLDPITEHLTMYASRYDNALLLSETLHRHPRAGLLYTGPITTGLDTIDVSEVDPTFLHHSYLARATPLEKDITELLSGKYPPTRAGLHRIDQGGQVFWQLH